MISNKLRWIFIGALFVIFIFVIIKIISREFATFYLFFSVVFLCFVLAILNGRRYIKYQKWYLAPESLDPFFMKFVSKDEKTIAWMHILIGICGIILLLFIIIQFFV